MTSFIGVLQRAQMLKREQVLSLLQVSDSTLARGVKSGRIPAPLKIGARRVAWRACDIERYLDGLASGGVA